jgi:hypothetical protein
METKKLFLVHCGFYDSEISDGVYESHVNYMVVADSFDDARVQVRLHPEFAKKKMHVDGMQWIEAVNGFKVQLERDPAYEGQSRINTKKHRDFATAKPAASFVDPQPSSN